MVQINFARKEINCKIVYYGPGMSGKTTNLEMVHRKTPDGHKGELTCIATEGDRTLFFDFMPLHLGNIMGMNIKFQLYTVPGQVYYNSTRKLVLRGADGVIFIADSSPDKMAENVESLKNLEENLTEYGKDVKDVPIVIQFNKRDLPNAVPVPTLNEKLNWLGVPTFEASARTGEGVFATLKALSGLVIEGINQREDKTFSAAKQAEMSAASGTTEAATATAPSTAIADEPAAIAPPASPRGFETTAPPPPPSIRRPAPAAPETAVPSGRLSSAASGKSPAESPRAAATSVPAPPAPKRPSAAGGTTVHGRSGTSPSARPAPRTFSASALSSSDRSGSRQAGRPKGDPKSKEKEAEARRFGPLQIGLLLAFAVLFAVTLYFVFVR